MNQRFAVCAAGLAVTLAVAPWACGSSGKDSIPAPDAAIDGPGSGTSSGAIDANSSSSSSGSPVDAGVYAPPTDAGASVLQVGHDVYHRMTYAQPTLTHAAVTTMAPDTAFNANATYPANGNTTGQGVPSVLYLEGGPAQAGCPAGVTGCTATGRPAGGGVFLAFAALGGTPNVFAFDEGTGLPAWTAHVKNGATNGGDGIRGTPAVDPVSRRIFVVTGNNPHTIHALSVDTGEEVTTGGWPVTLSLSTVAYQDAGFNSVNQNQRGALLLLGNTLYIPFGGEDGDGGNYRGWVVAVDITNPATIGAWSTLSPQSGIWASGGLASDGTHVFAETGNSTGAIRPDTTPMSAWDSEAVVALTGLAKPARDATGVFVANEWLKWDHQDLDFGSSSPAVAPFSPGSDPPSLVIAPAKAGTVYILNGSNLSTGVWPGDGGGELAELGVANTGGSSMYTAPTIYGSTSGLHTAIAGNQGPFSLCPTADTKSASGAIVSILLDPGHTPIAKVAWCAKNTVGSGSRWFPPISTTSDGISADPIVWFLSSATTAGDNQLTGVDGDNGNVLVATTGTACSTVPSLSFPIAVKGRIVVAALGHLCSWSLTGGH